MDFRIRKFREGFSALNLPEHSQIISTTQKRLLRIISNSLDDQILAQLRLTAEIADILCENPDLDGGLPNGLHRDCTVNLSGWLVSPYFQSTPSAPPSLCCVLRWF